jgi:diaminopimelate epimerase
MKIEFYKYHGTGNDFVIVDNRNGSIRLDEGQVNAICSRRFGVGADGLMLLEKTAGFDFKMIYFNSDGKMSSMCGNGGRCLVQFAQDIGVIKEKAHFIAIDGEHDAELKDGWVHLKMNNTAMPVEKDKGYFLDSGSPHHVLSVARAEGVEVFSEGRRLRNEVYGEEGANINFVEKLNDSSVFVRTYERGVEDETYSCGTGVTASAIIAYQNKWVNAQDVNISTLGGDLKVSFQHKNDGYENVWLKGPAVRVYKGEIEI